MTVVGTAFVELRPEATRFIGNATSDAHRYVDGFTGSADGRLRDSRSTFVRAGENIGDDIGTGAASGVRPGIGRAAGFITGAFKQAAGLAVAYFAVTSGMEFFKGMSAEAREAGVVTRQTEATLKSMGQSAGLSAGQIGDLSTSLSNYAGVDDEAIQSAENLLLTFGNIRNVAGQNNDIFTQASKITVDMAARFGGDLNGAAIKVGKALNDPIRGLASLSKIGVQFTEGQKEQIKTMVESGDIMGAQKIIVAELGRQTAGAAAAAADPMQRLKVVFANIQEELGLRLMPVINALADGFATGLPIALDATFAAGDAVWDVAKRIGSAFGDMAGFVERNATAFEVGAAAITGFMLPALVRLIVVQAVQGFTAAVALGTTAAGWVAAAATASVAALSMAASWLIAMGPIGLLIGAIAGLAVLIFKNWDDIKLGTQIAWNFISDKVTGAWSVVSTKTGEALDAVIGFFTGLPDRFNTAWTGAQAWFEALPERIAFGLGFLAGRLISVGLDAIGGLWSGIVLAWDAGVWFFTELPARIGAFLIEAGNWLLDRGNAVVSGLWAGIRAAWDIGVTFLTELPGRTLAFFIDAGNWLLDRGNQITSGAWAGIRAGWSAGVTFFTELPFRLWDMFKDAATWLVRAGEDIVSGIVTGIGRKWDAAVNKIKGLAGALGRGFGEGIEAKSPSLLFMRMAEYIPEGVAAGIDTKAHLPREALNRMLGGIGAPNLGLGAGGGAGGLRIDGAANININIRAEGADPATLAAVRGVAQTEIATAFRGVLRATTAGAGGAA